MEGSNVVGGYDGVVGGVFDVGGGGGGGGGVVGVGGGGGVVDVGGGCWNKFSINENI